MTQKEVTSFFVDWWGFIVFAAGGLIGGWVGLKRREWELQKAATDIVELKARIENAEKDQREQRAQLIELATTLKHIVDGQERIYIAIDQLRHDKVDR